MVTRLYCSSVGPVPAYSLDTGEAGGYCSVGSQPELPGYVVSGAERGGVVQFVFYHFGRIEQLRGVVMIFPVSFSL